MLQVGGDGRFALARGFSSWTRQQSKADDNRALVTLTTGSIFLGTGIAGLKNRKYPTDFDSLVHMGFGAVQPKSFVSFITASVCVF